MKQGAVSSTDHGGGKTALRLDPRSEGVFLIQIKTPR
jgi:hypothetical protein